MADQPWHELPPEIATALRPALVDLADEMIDAVRTVPAYSRPLEGPFGEGIRAGVQGALPDQLQSPSFATFGAGLSFDVFKYLALVTAILGIAVGVVLLLWPLSGALSLTSILIVFFVIKGVASIMFALQHKRELSG